MAVFEANWEAADGTRNSHGRSSPPGNGRMSCIAGLRDLGWSLQSVGGVEIDDGSLVDALVVRLSGVSSLFLLGGEGRS